MHSQVEIYRRGRQAGGGDHATDDTTQLLGRALVATKLELQREQVRRLKIANDQAERKFIDRDEAEIEVAEWFSRIRDRLDRLPADVATEVPADVKVAVMTKARRVIDLLFDEIRGWEDRGFES